MYDRPVTRYVADFIGESNLLRAAVRGVEGPEVVLGIGPATVRAVSARSWAAGAEAWLAVRPEYLRPATQDEGPNRLNGIARESVFTGSITRQYVTMADGSSVVFHLPAGTPPPAAGSPLTLTWPVERGICVGE
jgi:spermidine/putrescine transport system ATP-binding protein